MERPGKNVELYDLYEDERPLRWINTVVWGIIVGYLIFALIGVATTPIENGRPVLADAEYRRYERYVSTINQKITEVQSIYDELRATANAYRLYASSRASDSAYVVRRSLARLEDIQEMLERMQVPERFSGVIGSSSRGDSVNERAFHFQFMETVSILSAYAEELYRYFTDFDERRWETIDALSRRYYSSATEAFSLFRRIVGDRPGGR